MSSGFDAEIVGSGPNGLAAAVTLARAGLRVCVIEAAASPGGSASTRSGLLGEGVRSDVGSAVHPMAVASPFFRMFELAERIEMVVPEVSFAHPLDGGRGGIAYRDLARTIGGLDTEGARWKQIFRPLVDSIGSLSEITSGTLQKVLTRPDLAIELGLRIIGQATQSASTRADSVVSAMLAGLSAHSIAPLPSVGASSVGLVLGAHAHAAGWPVPVGGSQAISDAMITDLIAHGGVVELGHRVNSMRELDSPIRLFDVSARTLASIGDGELNERYLNRLRAFTYGGAASKVDFLLDSPVPWSNQEIARAGTVHLGGTWQQIAFAESELQRGRYVDRPYVMVSQPSALDASRAPAGRHVLWTYTHVPNGSDRNMTEVITNQIERFAPGFRGSILRSVHTTAARIGQLNTNHVGGDIGTGAITLSQLIARPRALVSPWATGTKGVFLCSAGTSPGPGVHGMAGFHAARAALRDIHGVRETPRLGRDT